EELGARGRHRRCEAEGLPADAGRLGDGPQVLPPSPEARTRGGRQPIPAMAGRGVPGLARLIDISLTRHDTDPRGFAGVYVLERSLAGRRLRKALVTDSRASAMTW